MGGRARWIGAAVCVALGAAATVAAKDWTAHTGKALFVVGLEPGWKEARFTGRSPMLFLTRAEEPPCARYGARTWGDAKVLQNISAYTPVLVDCAEDDATFKRYAAKGALPVVVWLDHDGATLLTLQGDVPIEVARDMAEIARKKAPKAKPSPEYVELRKTVATLQEAAAAGEIRRAVGLLAEVRGVGLGLALQREAQQVDAELTKQGEAAIEQAKDLVVKHRPFDARKIYEALVADFGDHPIGRKAQALLDELTGKGPSGNK